MGSKQVILGFSIGLFVISTIFLLLTIYSPYYLNSLPIVGYATAGPNSTGKINLSIQSAVVINFSVDVIDWGSGRVNAGALNATLDTSKSNITRVSNGYWSNSNSTSTSGLNVDNLGNVNVTLWIKTNQNSTTFIGGDTGGGPLYRFNISNNLSGACDNNSLGISFALGQWYDVNITGDGRQVCNNFSYHTGQDRVHLDIFLSIPLNSKTGYFEDNITATAYQSA